VAGSDLPYSEWCPPELTAAAGPLRSAAELLRALSDDSAGLERFADSSPDPQVRRALAEFVERWQLALWSLAGTASSLATNLRWAAEDYVGSEADLARRLGPDHEGRRR
jgi:hypothetical protein